VRLSDLAARLGAELRGDGQLEVRRVAGIEVAEPGDLTFVANRRYLPHLKTTRASAVIVAPDVETSLPRLVTRNPYLAYARAVPLLHPPTPPSPGIHPTAVVDSTAGLGADVHVGPYAVIGARARLGARSVLHAHVVVYPEAQIGEDCVLHSGVHVREGCRLGHRVVVQNGAVIGGDGFGFARDEEGRHHKILQIGTVVIEDDVEIGALSAVDRAALQETRIGRGTKIDNLVQIGHSVVVGADTIMAGQVGVAGSTRIGDRVILAGQVGVAGHLTIGDGAVVTAQAGVPGDVDPGSVISGSPAVDNPTWLRTSVALPRLPELLRRVRDLERRLERAEAPGEAQGPEGAK
jgi:UDP-3-O-[3-hydroxymyristoyl] glucosamine N-acyltransferase